MKRLLVVLILSLAAFQINAQVKKNDKDIKVTGSGTLPNGWHLRLDHKNADPKDLKFTENNGAFYFLTGPAGIYFQPKQAEKDNFMISAKFVQQKESEHPEAYGLFFAGKNLTAADQYYLYFLVRQDGKYLIKERKGNNTHVIIDWTANKSVNAKDKTGATENILAVKVVEGIVQFYCNGKKLLNLTKDKIPGPDGQVGLRVNHNLNLAVSDYQVKSL